MKKSIIALAMLCSLSLSAQAQQIYDEVMRMQKSFQTVKLDESKDMAERKVASFKWDVIEYMLYKGKDDDTFTEQQLGEQTNAMIEYLTLYFKRLGEAKNKAKKDIVVTRFKNASINNSFFHDMDQELVLAYYNSSNFATPFSLDTDWTKALAEIRSKSWD